MRAADEAMYESKRAGRNRVTSAAGRASGWLDLPWRAVDWDAERLASPRPTDRPAELAAVRPAEAPAISPTP
jgi:hypothetical protein